MIEFKQAYTLEDVQNDFWVLSRLYYNEVYEMAFALTNDHKVAKEAVTAGFHSMSWCRIYDYDNLETIRKELGEFVEKHAKRLTKVVA